MLAEHLGKRPVVDPEAVIAPTAVIFRRRPHRVRVCSLSRCGHHFPGGASPHWTALHRDGECGAPRCGQVSVHPRKSCPDRPACPYRRRHGQRLRLCCDWCLSLQRRRPRARCGGGDQRGCSRRHTLRRGHRCAHWPHCSGGPGHDLPSPRGPHRACPAPSTGLHEGRLRA